MSAVLMFNFVIRCSDIDIAAIMLGNMHHLESKESHVWILAGSGNKLRYVDKIQGASSLCRSLLGFHTIAGCNYNFASFKRGNQRPFQCIEKNPSINKHY